MQKIKSKSSLQRCLRHISHMPIISLTVMILAAGLGLFFSLLSANTESALALWAFGAAIIIPYVNFRFIFQRRGSAVSRTLGFAVAAASLAASNAGYVSIGLALALLSPVTYFSNKKMFAACAIPVLIWTLAVPNAEFIHYFMSYPLRYVTAEISAAALSMAGFAATSADTLILIGGKQIAVTSACSGIEQLEAMLLIAWIIAVIMRRNTYVRIIHFATILPIIIIANSLRLVVTLAGYETVGDVFLSDGVHTWLGFGMVAVSTILFIAAGALFPKNLKLEAKQ